MRGKTLRPTLVAVAAFALSAVLIASAFASVHITSSSAVSTTLSASLVSTGDAGSLHGNLNLTTSPILSAPPTEFYGWFNQPVTFSNLVIMDPSDDTTTVALAGSFYQRSPDGVTWGADVPFVDSAAVANEGLYSLTATGTEAAEPDDVMTGTILPAFGIDMTKPMSTSDAVPVYSGTALVTITATDTLSGIENLQYSVKSDGPFDYASDADPGSTFTVPVTFGPGSHTLRWHAFDNAGNIDGHAVSFIVRPLGFVPTVMLSAKVHTGDKFERHNVTFAGTVSPIATSMPLTVTIQRWRPKSKIWAPYSSYTHTIPMYASSFSDVKHVPSDDKFRAMASFDGGSSPWATFTTH
jgi:hypothetical protein